MALARLEKVCSLVITPRRWPWRASRRSSTAASNPSPNLTPIPTPTPTPTPNPNYLTLSISP